MSTIAAKIALFKDSDIWFSFKNNPVAIIAAVVAFVLIVGALLQSLHRIARSIWQRLS
jgi:hypothetical protein